MDKTFRFPCDRWLAKNDDDGQIMRELACANNDYLDLDEKTSKSRTRGVVVQIPALLGLVFVGERAEMMGLVCFCSGWKNTKFVS